MKLVSIAQNAQQTGGSVWRETNEALMRIFSGSLNTAAAGWQYCEDREKQKIVKRNSFAKMILLPLYYTRLIGKF